MIYFKSPESGEVFAYDADQVEAGVVKPGLVKMSDAEVLAHLAPPAPTQELINAQARAYLASTDWYVIRMQETGAPIPDDILLARQAARDRVVDEGADL